MIAALQELELELELCLEGNQLHGRGTKQYSKNSQNLPRVLGLLVLELLFLSKKFNVCAHFYTILEVLFSFQSETNSASFLSFFFFLPHHKVSKINDTYQHCLKQVKLKNQKDFSLMMRASATICTHQKHLTSSGCANWPKCTMTC